MVVKVEPIEKYTLKKDEKEVTRSEIINKVGIVGCGNLGQEIARIVSSHGIEVIFLELSKLKIEDSINGITRTLNNQIERWGMTEPDKRAILSRINGTLEYNDLKGAQIVIEAIKSKTRENSVELRKKIFREIEKVVDDKTIIATNSTTLVITELSSELEHPERCVSLHFLSPASDVPIVEVARSLHTTDDAYKRVCKFARLLGKRIIPVVESPGVISTRLIAPMINEACEILMEGVASMEDIDNTMKLGFGFPYGPFEMADKIGIDIVVRWLDNLYREFGDIKYKASPMLKKRVRANHLGRDTGTGFYKYDEEGKKISTEQPEPC